MKKLTREQAAVVGIFTGICCGPFQDIHELAEKLTGVPVWTHQFADKEFVEGLKGLARDLFLSLCCSEEDS